MFAWATCFVIKWLLRDNASLEYALSNRYGVRSFIPRALLSSVFLLVFLAASYFGFVIQDDVRQRWQTTRIERSTLQGLLAKQRELYSASSQYLTEGLQELQQHIDDGEYQCPCQGSQVAYNGFVRFDWFKYPVANNMWKSTGSWACASLENVTDFKFTLPPCNQFVKTFAIMFKDSMIPSPKLLTPKSIVGTIGYAMSDKLDSKFAETKNIMASLPGKDMSGPPLDQQLFTFRETFDILMYEPDNVTYQERLARTNVTIRWPSYISACNPFYCEYKKKKPWFNYYLEIVALVWAVFSAGKGLLVLFWAACTILGAKCCATYGGDAEELAKSLIEPPRLWWIVPKVTQMRKHIKSSKFKIVGSNHLWYLQLEPDPKASEYFRVALVADELQRLPLGWSEHLQWSIDITAVCVNSNLHRRGDFVVSNTKKTYIVPGVYTAQFTNQQGEAEIKLEAQVRSQRRL